MSLVAIAALLPLLFIAFVVWVIVRRTEAGGSRALILRIRVTADGEVESGRRMFAASPASLAPR